MSRLKYVIFDDCIPLLFSEATKHVNVRDRDRREATSAGFFQVQISPTEKNPLTGQPMLKVHCFGKSESLKLESKEHDSYILERFLNS